MPFAQPTRTKLIVWNVYGLLIIVYNFTLILRTTRNSFVYIWMLSPLSGFYLLHIHISFRMSKKFYYKAMNEGYYWKNIFEIVNIFISYVSDIRMSFLCKIRQVIAVGARCSSSPVRATLSFQSIYEVDIH